MESLSQRGHEKARDVDRNDGHLVEQIDLVYNTGSRRLVLDPKTGDKGLTPRSKTEL